MYERDGSLHPPLRIRTPAARLDGEHKKKSGLLPVPPGVCKSFIDSDNGRVAF